MVIATDIGKAVGADKLDGWVMTSVEVVEVGKDGSDNPNVESIIGKDEFAKAGEGRWKDEVDVVVVCDKVFEGGGTYV